jgi:hypothetical protein
MAAACEGEQPFRGRHGLMSAYVATFGPSRPPQFFLFGVRRSTPAIPSYSSRSLTMVAYKPSITIERATSSYSFRFSELSQPI